ncbi:hypothetical protein [Hymenobacter lapidarius]|uniref:hypothetical protein n=1 Tax=Hymenobacter lapidarius TaxID=1908237 RepID=UPI000F77D64C|nr:hypothetical protein [Hymenobacter lapidarius]
MNASEFQTLKERLDEGMRQYKDYAYAEGVLHYRRNTGRDSLPMEPRLDNWEKWLEHDLPVYYGPLYTTCLITYFGNCDVYMVRPYLNKQWKHIDIIDLEYLKGVFAEIRLRIVEASTSLLGRKNYYCSILDRFVDCDKRVVANCELAELWLEEKRQSMNQTSIQLPSPVRNDPSSLNWTGSVADLAELLYRMARGGFIDLAAHRGPDGNLSALCRHVCQLFQVPPTASKNAATALSTYLSKFTPEQLSQGHVDEEVLSKANGRKPNNANTIRLANVLNGLDSTRAAAAESGEG